MAEGPAPAASKAIAKPAAKKTSLNAGELPRGTNWAQLFAQKRLDTSQIRVLVAELAEAQRHQDVIGLLEEALIQGRAEPWMYEVLALSMEIVGRPRDDIERVLLSSRDLVPADTASLLYLASYLARFDRLPQALRCCRQAAEVEPNRSEPYLEGLRFATKLRDAEGMAWAAVGTLLYAWGPDLDEHHRQAEAAVADAREMLLRAGRSEQVEELDRQLQAARSRDLVVRLDWSGNGDLDLIVTEPAGTVCSRSAPYSRGGGIYVHDGHGPAADNTFDEYLCPIGLAGVYRVAVRHSAGAIVGKRARLTIIRHAGSPQEQREVITVAVGDEDQIVRLTLRHGRREKLAAALPQPPQRILPAVAKVSVSQQLSPAVIQSGRSTPFVLGQAANVGPGAVGYTPVVQFINEGVSLTAMATISGDRRYVRLSMNPVFNAITDVFTFTPIGR